MKGRSVEKEETYRRAYADGFIVGVDALGQMLLDGVDKNEAYECCWDFWHECLVDWYCDDCTKVVRPPDMRIEAIGT